VIGRSICRTRPIGSRHWPGLIDPCDDASEALNGCADPGLFEFGDVGVETNGSVALAGPGVRR
jgi:hypothetical protein